MPTDHRAELAAIKRFDQLIKYLRDRMGWPIDGGDFEELTFEYTPEELGIDAKNAAKIQEIRRLRPLSTRQPWGVFFVKFEPKKLPVVALRRILGQVALKKRASANSAERAAWSADDLLFVSNFGESDHRQISFAHFSKPADGHDLPTLKVLGWDNLDTALHLDSVAKELSQHLTWPEDDTDIEAWRERWRAAFTLRHREVVSTSKELSIRLAELARAIRDRIETALGIETERGPLTQLMKAFREALIHDLEAAGFADMYAQTIAYGLLSARIANPRMKTADDFAGHMRTNPFLRELMQSFLRIGGRRGRVGGPGIDFDELGVGEVVGLLDDANMEAVIRDFGDRNPRDDPVIHFYEDFLREYDPSEKKQRGVFYTPRPVVSYIVRSVDELLRSEFGLTDGLADTTTWGEMAEVHRGLTIPEGVPSLQPFVQILDPATGTGTFLVEAIDLIHKTMVGKWKVRGHDRPKIETLWNEYVAEQLLPRLHGYELLMAPYAIAHLKIGLKLHETGYRFGSDERAQIYLTNALEPPNDAQFRTTLLPALAHEGRAVNAVKRMRRFTVVLGNPPYAGISSNMSDDALRIVDAYKIVDGAALNERKLWLQDDYVKFIRRAQLTIEQAHIGILGYITNHGYLDNPTFRGMRQSLMGTFSRIRVLNLHGNANKKEQSPDGSDDSNVFEIRQGVAICLATRADTVGGVEYADLWGTREFKYSWLADRVIGDTGFAALSPDSPYYFFEPQDTGHRTEYNRGWPINELMPVNCAGFITARDHFVVDIERDALLQRIGEFGNLQISDARIRERYFAGYGSAKYPDGDARGWKVPTARRRVAADKKWRERVRTCLYRPFDTRQIYWAEWMVDWPRPEVMRHVTAKDSLALATTRSVEIGTFEHVFCSRLAIGHHTVSLKEVNYMFPLHLLPDEEADEGQLRLRSDREPNFAPAFLRALATTLGLPQMGRHGLPAGVTAEQIFYYIYALLECPSYRKRYAELLNIDFPRVPLPATFELFGALTLLGGELVSLHLMESPSLDRSIASFTGPKNAEITRVGWSEGTVWLDAAVTPRGEPASPGSFGFRGVPEAVWNFRIGGYQVCEKWLKDRRGRTLSKDDIAHYQKIVVALNETVRLMTEIDEVIGQHGGWPAAFAASPPSGIDVRSVERLPTDASPKDWDVGAEQRPLFEPPQLPLRRVAEASTHDYGDAPTATPPVEATTSHIELDRADMMAHIRQLFTDGEGRDRATAIAELSEKVGHETLSSLSSAGLDGAIRIAVRRGVLENVDGLLRLAARSIDQYERNFLKQQFMASLVGKAWINRDEAIRAFARWLGFRRTGSAIDDVARSVINGLIREGRLESDGTLVRKAS
jgi:hypothetical protein